VHLSTPEFPPLKKRKEKKSLAKAIMNPKRGNFIFSSDHIKRSPTV